MTSPRESGTIAARMVKRGLELAERRGLDPRPLCAAAGIDLAAFDDPDARLPYGAVDDLVAAIAAAVEDPVLGLQLAAVQEDETYDVAGLVLLASPTLRAGLERSFRYQALWGDGERFTLHAQGDCARVRFTPVGPPHPAHVVLADCALTEILAGVRFVTGTPVEPRAVSFRRQAPPDPSAHAAIFGPRVTFGAAENAITLDAAVLDLPLTQANAMFCAFFEKQAERAVARLARAEPENAANVDAPAKTPTTERVRAAVRTQLAGGDFRLSAIAAQLHMSARTLQRRLRDEGATLDEVVEALRAELAEVYLDKGLAIAEVAFLLGYAEPSAFHRAFRRRTGTSPEAWRKQRRALAGPTTPPR